MQRKPILRPAQDNFTCERFQSKQEYFGNQIDR
jgi:hypothetical protein